LPGTHTNQEIAAQLYINPRIVEWHLGNVSQNSASPPAKTSADPSPDAAG